MCVVCVGGGAAAQGGRWVGGGRLHSARKSAGPGGMGWGEGTHTARFVASMYAVQKYHEMNNCRKKCIEQKLF